MLIAIAFIIVSPITYMTLHGWLEGFAYRVNINLLVFVLGVSLAIGLLTISYHTAQANPVKELRYE
jgi:putative ABC transport system permease protein